MKQVLTFLTLLVLLFVTISLASAQAGGGYELTWSTIDNGGSASTDGSYTLNGTIGQPDTSIVLAGGGYTLVGGFWGGAMTSYRIYLPVVIKGS